MSEMIYIILVVVLLVIIIILIMYNKLVRLYHKAMKEQANIEVCLKKRFDLIPNLVETVKGYSKHEDETLEKVIALRNNYDNAENLKMSDVSNMNKELNRYLAIFEQYPDLKANTQYLNLQNELSNIENQLQRYRTTYNDVVTNYNTTREVVPSNIIAEIFAFKKLDLFTIDEDEKENVKIKL